MMRYVLFDLALFNSPEEREDSEDTLLWGMEILTDRNVKFLQAHPDTPKLYDSGVYYALPEQLAECRVDAGKLRDLARYLRKIGAGVDTVEAVLSFLQGIEVFRDIPRILEKRGVDCDNLSSWRCAELRNAGVKASPYITWREQPHGTTYHALVRWPDGTSEDPSILLGMGGEDKAVERAEERRKNQERFETFVEAARALCNAGGSAAGLGQKIDALGLLPKRGWV